MNINDINTHAMGQTQSQGSMVGGMAMQAGNDPMGPIRRRRRVLIDYLKEKVEEADWHGVSDVANDLRVLEAKYPQVL